jgi:hypothetical protein
VADGDHVEAFDFREFQEWHSDVLSAREEIGLMATVTGTITDAHGTPYTSYVRFWLRDQPQVRGTSVINHRPVDVLCNSVGYFTTTLVTGCYWLEQRGAKPFGFCITTDGTFNLADLIEDTTGLHNYLMNDDDGLYYQLYLVGQLTLGTLSLIINPVSVIVPPSGAMTSLYLMNTDDSLYHRIGLLGSPTLGTLGLTIDPVGVGAVPSGAYGGNVLVLWSEDEARTRDMTCVGTGATLTLTFT